MGEKKKDPIEEVLSSVMIFIFELIKSVVGGLLKLRSIKGFLLLLLALLISVAGYFLKDLIFQIEAPKYITLAVYWGILLVPVWYLMIQGQLFNGKINKHRRVFENAALVSKDGRVPMLIAERNKGKMKTYVFKSEIPLDKWKEKKTSLETGFDCNILLFKEGSTKKISELVTVPSSVKIPEMLEWKDGYTSPKDGVITVGESALEQVTFNLNNTPHALVAGETGSGKSVILRTIARQLMLKGCKIFMIDFKGGVEFGIDYERFGEVIMERERALEVLEMLVAENTARLNLFRPLKSKNLSQYNKKTGSNLCRVALFCDELGEMLDKKGVAKEEKEVMERIEKALSTLARLARAPGIHIFLGVQRPDANVLTGQIKNNIPLRISGRFADKAASEIVLGSTDAVNLPEVKGRFLYKLGNDITVFQAYYFDDDTMLTDIDVEQGTMLVEGMEYKPPARKKKVTGGRGTKKIESTSEQNIEKAVDTSGDSDKGFELDFDFDDE